MLALATTVAALTAFGAAPATSTVAAAPEYRPTTLVAGYPNPLKTHVVLQPRAKLTDAATGAPIAGQRVVFLLDLGPLPAGGPFCSAQTDAAGVAKCSVGLRTLLEIVGVGYEARFDSAFVGDIWYGDSRDLVKFLGPQ